MTLIATVVPLALTLPLASTPKNVSDVSEFEKKLYLEGVEIDAITVPDRKLICHRKLSQTTKKPHGFHPIPHGTG